MGKASHSLVAAAVVRVSEEYHLLSRQGEGPGKKRDKKRGGHTRDGLRGKGGQGNKGTRGQEKKNEKGVRERRGE